MPEYYLQWVLYFVSLFICLLSGWYVNTTMKRFRSVSCYRGKTGAEVAREILNENGLYHVSINVIGRDGGDYYDPRTESVNLSTQVYDGRSVTALAVAAHECGHAIQHSEGYAPLQFRTALVPVVNFASNASMPILILGLFLNYNPLLIQIGLIAFSMTVVFSIATLPVEFNASARAIRILEDKGFVMGEEKRGCQKVLIAAALTYVASVAAAVLQLLRLWLQTRGRRRD